MPWRGPAAEAPVDLPGLPALPDKAMAEELVAALDRSVDESFPLIGATHLTLAVWSEDGWYQRGEGAAGGEAAWWASTGKLFTATLIFQLIDEGKLGLGDRLATWFPDYPGADLITVDQLLSHTSGAFSFNADKKLQRRRGYKSPELLLKTAARHGLDFCPGEYWHYSNTGYLLLGLVAETIDDASYADIVRRRILAPLSLDGLVAVQRGGRPAVAGVEPDSPRTDEIAGIHGAGSIAGTAEDMVRFLAAFLRGELFSRELLSLAFERRYPMFGQPMSYGRGVMVIAVPDPEAPTRWAGHSGGAPGAKSVLALDLERGVLFGVAINRNGPAEALANNLLKRLDQASGGTELPD